MNPTIHDMNGKIMIQKNETILFGWGCGVRSELTAHQVGADCPSGRSKLPARSELFDHQVGAGKIPSQSEQPGFCTKGTRLPHKGNPRPAILRYIAVLAVLLFVTLPKVKGQTTFDVNVNGTNGGYYTPFYTAYRYSTVAFIYTAAEMNHSGLITNIAFYSNNNTNSLTFSSLKIYFITTSATTFSSTSNWTTTGLTQVYSGTQVTVGDATGWMNIALDKPYDYKQDEGNLMVIVTKETNNYSNAQRWRYYGGPNNTVLYRGNNSNTDYANVTNTTSGTISSVRPQVRFTLLPAGSSVDGGTSGPTNVGYVIYNGTYYMGGSSTDGINTFNPSTCLWTGTSGGTWRNTVGYYINSDNNGSNLRFSTTNNNRNWSLTGTESGTTGSRIYRTNNNRYIYFNGTNWATAQNQTANIVFAATVTTYNETYTIPAIGGATEISTLGVNDINTVSTNAAYRKKYFDYIFYNGAHHYVDVDNQTLLTSPPTASDFEYIWSLEGATGYATINEDNGTITYSTSTSSDLDVTVKLTATSDEITYVVTKTVTLRPVPFYYKVNANAEPSTGGKVYAGINNGTPTGSTATFSGNTLNNTIQPYLVASANEGYEFKWWSTTRDGVSVSDDASYRPVLNVSSTNSAEPSEYTFYAQFGLKPSFYFSATAIVSGANGCGTATATVSNSVVQGEHWNSTSAQATATYTATANSGYEFVGWYSDAGFNSQVSTNSTYTTTITSTSTTSSSPTNTTLYARFEPLPVFYFSATAIASPSAGGTASVSPSTTSVMGVTLSATSAQATVTYTATANSGYEFVGWYSDAGFNSQVSTNSTYTTTITSTSTSSSSPTNTTLYARFEAIPTFYFSATATASPSAGGTVTASVANSEVSGVHWNDGTATTSATFTATANSGYEFVGWYSNAGLTAQVSTSSTYTTTITSTSTNSSSPTNTNLYARFEAIPTFHFSATAIASPSTGGTATASVAESVIGEHWNTPSATAVATFTATPSTAGSGYRFLGWSETADGTTYVNTNTSFTETLTSTTANPASRTLYARFQVYPTAIITSDNSLTICREGSDVIETFTYDIEASGAYDNVVVNSSNNVVATANLSGNTVTVTAKSAGEASITLQARRDDNTPLSGISTSVLITVNERVATPTISFAFVGTDNGEATITCSNPTDATIYYTINGETPDLANYGGANPTQIYDNSNKPVVAEGVTIKAIAVKAGYWCDSEVATKVFRLELAGSGTATDPYLISSDSDYEMFVNRVNENAAGAAAYYKVTGAFTVSSTDPITRAFTGNFDGGYYIISGLSHAMFNTINGGTVKNVILDNVNISSGENVGAIANVATGNTKIYNCGVLATTASSISGTGAVGGLVGLIQQNSNVRVVNCYNYATVSGGTYAGGIVGQNAGTISNINTGTNANPVYSVNTTGVRITNCMMYGDLTSGTNRSPVYAGIHASNVQRLTEYNYYRSRANLSYTAYNDQLAIDKDEYLTRFPFYRHIQNTHREMAANFLFGAQPTAAQVAEIGHWVLNTEVAPYPIIEPWETNTKKTTVDRANNLPNTAEDYVGKLLTEMGNSGYLTVNVSINGSSFTSQLPITDMDTLRYDFTWGKVVLPFANEYSGWTRDYSKICTGWKITSITGGTAGTLSNYNFADRDCTAKDLFSNSGYIFAQGGNYIVPYGVTAINIEANFANAFYLSDAYSDFGYSNSYANQTNLGWAVPTTYHGRTVYTSLETLVNALSSTTNPHAQAIVLVGNYHYNQNTIGGTRFDTGKAVTIMSVDEDNNQEPDYGWYSYHTTDRTAIPPMRFDFVPNIGMGMAERVTGSTPYPTIGIWHSRGWFELTETCVSFMSECEINDGDFTNNENNGNNRWIANSGYFLQIVRARASNATKLSYLQIGGNAYVEQLYPGSHTDNALQTTIRPIIVNGGEIEDCYMTGYKAGATATGANIYFWCAGGRIHKWLGSYLENPSTNGVNVTAKIDHARIYRFFGGGTSSAARITGNIDITMNNSLVDFYCGGPEFGDMAAGKTVTTHATGTTFGEFYGAGFGGTSITYNREAQNSGLSFGSATVTYPPDFSTNYKRLTVNNNYGIGNCYKFEYFLYSGGNGTGVARFFTGYAQFSLATTGNVTNVLDNCTVKRNYYGAGCQGKVQGTVESTLTNCNFEGSVFGGGYKATANTLNVYTSTQPTYSVYTRETGLFSDFGTVAPETFTWQYRATAGANDTEKILYTTTDMSTLGTVTGAISLIVDGGTVGGHVFGGGNESPSSANASVLIRNNTMISENVFGGGNVAIVGGNASVAITGAAISGSVYGGGNNVANNLGVTGNAEVNISGATTTIASGVYGGCNIQGRVAGNTEVTLMDGTVGTASRTADVHGGGYGQNTEVAGNVTVTVGATDQTTGGVAIYGDLYGGSALGNVNTNTSNTTQLNLYMGRIDGNVYGGGLGQKDGFFDATSDIESLVRGDVAIDLNGYMSGSTPTPTDGVSITGSVFGCNNLNGTPLGHVKVHVYKTVTRNNSGTIQAKPTKKTSTYELAAVYGGGNMAAYEPTAATNTSTADDEQAYTEVIIDGCDLTSIDYVYGGGNAASVPATSVTVNGCYEIGWLFGGGNGKDDLPNGDPNPGANVGYYAYEYNGQTGEITGDDPVSYGTGKTSVNLLGGMIHNAFGGSNTKGNVRESAVAFVDEASDCTLLVDGIYGGGNEAYMEGKSELKLGCITSMDVLYGGSRRADVGGDIELTITSGHFGRVFGGNNESGHVRGTITVNIEETGCYPVTIGELYGGGNLAAYSVEDIPANHPSRSKEEDDEDYYLNYPKVNVKSFTSIGRVFGGGLGETAVVTGNPMVNINVVEGEKASYTPEPDAVFAGTTINLGDGTTVDLPAHTAGAIGAIGTVFGGGNAAKVDGNTTVKIGTETTIDYVSKIGDETAPRTNISVKGVKIIDNVYGGGNNADVTGKTNVVIGREN